MVTDRWQKFTDLALSRESLEKLAAWCAEFLIHAVDVEGQCRGIDQELVSRLGRVVADSGYLCGRRKLTRRLGNGHAA